MIEIKKKRSEDRRKAARVEQTLKDNRTEVHAASVIRVYRLLAELSCVDSTMEAHTDKWCASKLDPAGICRQELLMSKEHMCPFSIGP